MATRLAERTLNPFALDAPELIQLIDAKNPRAIGSWRDLGGEEYGRSFAVAGTMGYDIIGDLHDGLLETFNEDGGTERDFVNRMLPILREKGWLADKSEAQKARRLLLIYDTNLRTGQAVGRWARIQATKAALPYLYGFTARDERVRHPPKSQLHDHRAFEGILLPVDHPFWTEFFPPLGFRCFLPQTRIEGAVKAAIRRWHDGPAVEVRTASGVNLSVTVDHPILTGRGWVLADHIRKGDRLIRRSREVYSGPSAVQNHQQSPPRADNLFKAAASHALTFGQPAPFKLNGKADGRKSEVDIVFVDRKLALEARSEVYRERVLIGADLASNEASAGFGAMPDPKREFNSRNAGQPGDFTFRAADAGRDGLHGSIWKGENNLAKGGLQGVVAGFTGLPGATTLPLHASRRLFNGLPLDRFGLASVADDDALFDQLALDGSAGDSGLFGYLVDTHSGDVALDEVVDIREFNFSGHVYDFQTEEGILAADSLVVHNCRCQVVQKTRSQALRLGSETSKLDLLVRMERLGRPFGFNPGRDSLEGVLKAAGRANDKRLEGAPPLNPLIAQAKAKAIWDKAMAGQSAKAKAEFRSPINPGVTAETIKVEPRLALQKRLREQNAEAANDPAYEGYQDKWGGRVPADRGSATLSSALSDEAASMLYALKPETDDLARQLGLPLLRGLKMTSGAEANMGDGILAINPLYFNSYAAQVGGRKVGGALADIATKRSEIQTLMRPIADEINELKRNYEALDLVGRKSGMAAYDTRRFALFKKLDKLRNADNKLWRQENDITRQEKDNKEVATWTRGDDSKARPRFAGDYFGDGVDKARTTLFHEFGHHVHHYLGKTTARVAGAPPLERKLDVLFREYLTKRRGQSASTYSETESQEWFAENFALFMMGRKDLVELQLKELIERLFRREAI